MSAPAPHEPPPGPVVPPRQELASWGLRALAALIDWLISLACAAPVAIVALLAEIVAPGLSDEEQDTLLDLTVFPIYFAWLLFYYGLTMRRRGAHNGQTWGKQAMKIRVAREDGYPVDARTAILRDAIMKNIVLWGFAVLACGIPPLLDVLWPLWDERNQSLHDKAASTLVLRA